MTIYLDHNATTPLDPRVLAAMLPIFQETYANPSSPHVAGRAAAELIGQARADVAALMGAPAGAQGYEVIFTSGATEAANLAIRGLLPGSSLAPGRSRVLVGSTEHRAVLEAARVAASRGRAVLSTVAARRGGMLDLDHLRSMLDGEPALVAVMAANNETGAITDIRQVTQLAHEAGALVFCDVTQAVGKIEVALDEWGVDIAAASAHKIGGPKGVGAMVVRRGLLSQLTPLTVGGGQERGLRPGTLNTPGIVGLGSAARLAAAERQAWTRRAARLTRLLHQLLTDRLGGVQLNGPVRGRLPNTLNLRFAGAPADAVLTCVPEVAMSPGSACHGAGDEPSHVLTAMGLDRTTALESLRFSLGPTTTEGEIRTAAALVGDGVEHVRGLRSSLVGTRPVDSSTTGAVQPRTEGIWWARSAGRYPSRRAPSRTSRSCVRRPIMVSISRILTSASPCQIGGRAGTESGSASRESRMRMTSSRLKPAPLASSIRASRSSVEESKRCHPASPSRAGSTPRR
jgi:cysteine desulfurase